MKTLLIFMIFFGGGSSTSQIDVVPTHTKISSIQKIGKETWLAHVDQDNIKYAFCIIDKDIHEQARIKTIRNQRVTIESTFWMQIHAKQCRSEGEYVITSIK